MKNDLRNRAKRTPARGLLASALAAALIAPPGPALLSAAEVAALQGVEVQADQITVHMDRQAKFNTFITADPPRLVIELLDTEYQAPAKILAGEGKYLRRVRSSQYQREPQMSSRIVLDLEKLVGYTARWAGNRLILTLGGSAPAAAAASAAPPAPAPSAAAPSADYAALQDIEVKPDAIAVALDRQAQFNSFVTAEPPRLVIELLDTEYQAPSKTLPGAGKLLRRVRSGQYQREPKMTARIILDLAKPAGYTAKWSGNRLLVALLGAPEPTPKAPAAVAKAPAAPAIKPEAESFAPLPPAPPPTPTPPADADEPSAALPAQMTTEASPELARIAQRGDVRPQGEADLESRRRRAAGEGRKSSPSRRDIIATLPTDPITLDFDDTDIQDILKLMATKAKVNLVYGPDVAGSVTLHLKDVPFNEAFATILAMNGLIPNQVGSNILRIMTPASLTKERSAEVMQTRVIRMKYAKAELILPAIQAVATAEQRAGKMMADKLANSLIVTDSFEGLAMVERMLAELDTRPQQVTIEAKLVEVNLSKDFAWGIQWEYLGSEPGKIGDQQGHNLIGTLTPPDKSSSETLQPLDRNKEAKTGVGAGGRGSGVFLPATKAFGAFTFGRITNNYFLSATLTAAAASGKAKVLSDPKITTVTGEKANINITTKIPFATSETTAGGGAAVTTQKVEYTTTGIELNVTPTVNPDGTIFMEVNPKVSQRSTVVASAGNTGAVATDQREAKTKVVVDNGGTLVIGGIITDSANDQVAKIPLLGDIPLIGWLFKKKFVERNRVELLIFVTAKVQDS